MIQKPFRGAQLNRTHSLAKGLVACYLFNEMTGETVFDLSGNGNNGTLENGVAWDNGGLKFDGADDYVDCGDNANAATIETTIEVWIKPYGFLHYPRIVTKTEGDVSSTWEGYGLLISAADNSIYASFGMDGGTNAKTTTPNNTVEINKYQHFVAVYNDTTKKCTLYKNGEYISGQTQTTGVGNRTNTSNHLFFGINYNKNTDWFNGTIRSVNIYNQAKSAEEVAWSYREPYAMFEPAFNPALLYSPTVIMNQFQGANLGADLYNGAIIA